MKWFKMHTDTVLDNPRIGLLPLETQAVFFKLYALAARSEAEGFIAGGLREIAWVLRLPEEVLAQHVQALGQAGLVARRDDGLEVRLYAEEQARAEREQARQRKRRQRERSTSEASEAGRVPDAADQGTDEAAERGGDDAAASRGGHAGAARASRRGHGDVTPMSRGRHATVTPMSRQGHAGVTEMSRLKKKRREEEKRTEENRAEAEAEEIGAAAAAAAVPEAVRRVYEADFGPWTPLLAAQVAPAVERHGERWVMAAMQEAVAANKRSWAYVRAILDRWGREGYGSPPPWKRRERDGPNSGHGDAEEVRRLEDEILRDILRDEVSDGADG